MITDEQAAASITPLSPAERLRRCVTSAIPAAMKTGLWLLKITVPLSFAVLLMKMTGVLGILARLFEPLFSLVGLPGEAAIVFVTSCLLNIYACIAVMETIGLSGRAVTIVAVMCLISHNLVVECAIQKKTGSSAMRMLLLRLCGSFVAGFALSRLMPADAVQRTVSAAAYAASWKGFFLELQKWFVSIVVLCVKIMVLVTALMILERVLQEFGVTKWLSKIMMYPLMLLGLPRETAFLWIVANVLGLTYGAGVMVDNVDRGLLAQHDADTLNHHIAISHSLLEDTCLFLAIGVSVWWITLPRLALAGAVVWLKRLIERLVLYKKTVH